MLKTSGSTESTTRPGKGGVGVGGDGGETLTSRLRTSSSTDSSTSAAQIVVEFDGVDAGGGAVVKSVEKSSKSRRIVKKVQKLQRSEKFAKAIGSEERLPKHRSSVNWIRRTRASVRALTVFRALLLSPGALSIPGSERLPTRQS